MSVQTSYATNLTASFAGMKADAGDDYVETGIAEGSGGIGFGLAVIVGTAAPQVKIPGAAGGVFAGVTLHTHAIEQPFPGTTETKYADKSAVSLGKRGKFWVQVAGAVVDRAPAFFVNTTGLFDDLDDATTDPVPTGIFRSATSGAGLAILEINIP